MIARAQKTRPRPPVTHLAAERDRRRMAADYRETLGLLQAATAPPPELVEQVARLEELVRDQAARIEAQEVRIAALEVQQQPNDEDGRPRRAGRWHRLKEASRRTGYSISGLKRLCRLGHVRCDYEGSHPLIDIDTVPRKLPKVPKVPKVSPC